jgi:hypothetical protein
LQAFTPCKLLGTTSGTRPEEWNDFVTDGRKDYFMKRVFMIATIVACVAVTSYGQDVLEKAQSALGSNFDVSSLTGSITSLLKTKLNLTDSQDTKVSKAVNTFLQAKAAILPLISTDTSEYNAKHASLFSKLKSSLSTILLKNQMNKFLGLKPETNDPADLLSNLFY